MIFYKSFFGVLISTYGIYIQFLLPVIIGLFFFTLSIPYPLPIFKIIGLSSNLYIVIYGTIFLNLIPVLNNFLNINSVIAISAMDESEYEMIYKYEENYESIQTIILDWNVTDTVYLKSKALEFDSEEDARLFYAEILNITNVGRNRTPEVPFLLIADGDNYYCSLNYYLQAVVDIKFTSSYTGDYNFIDKETFLNNQINTYSSEISAIMNDCDLEPFIDGVENVEYIRYMTTYVNQLIDYTPAYLNEAVSSIITGKGVCYNYSYVLAAIFTEAGYKNVEVISCKVDGYYHAITALDIGGERVYIDGTSGAYFATLPDNYELLTLKCLDFNLEYLINLISYKKD